MALNLKQPSRSSEKTPDSSSLSLEDLIGEEELPEGEEMEGEDDPLDFFSVDEAVQKLEEAGYALTPPEGEEGDMEEEEDLEGISEPVDINGGI